MAKKSFIRGAAILGAAGIVIKILGAFFRIPLSNLIGDTGMGYYQTAYPVYVLFLMISTAGIPIAISKMVSERIALGNYGQAHKVFKLSFMLLLITGVSSTVICSVFARPIVNLLENPNAYYAMLAIAPALLFVPIQAAYRGYFQGMQDMKPTAVSQVVEQTFRVILGLYLAYLFIKTGLDKAAAGAAFGATAGGIGGAAAIGLIYFFRRPKIKSRIRKSKRENPDDLEENSKEVILKLLTIAIPITIGFATMPIMNAVDIAIVMRRLQETGWTYEQANSLYGQLSGFAAPLINFPQALTQAVSVSLIPAVVAAYSLKQKKELHENIKLGLRSAVIVGLPCAVGLIVLAKPIMMTLYPTRTDSAVSAASSLAILALGVVFLSAVQTLAGVLQGIGKQVVPVRNLFIGVFFKVILAYVLSGIPAINVKGAAIGTDVAYMIAFVLNLIAVKKYTGVKFDFAITYVKPAISTAIMALFSFCTYKIASLILGNALSTLCAVAAAAVVYVVMVVISGAISLKEMEKLPKGKKLVKIVKMLRLRR
ncbi:MAG: putative polysaccharide biosynthesis protein [Eubacteriales bacterium]